MRGTLFIVSTPIGNLEDITLRALRVLREVSLIAAEDTRRTVKLLNHYDIRTPTTSFHRHNERSKVTRLLAHLESGKDVALVSDAGTPTLSDPGAGLVGAALSAGIRVAPLPGASAILAALVASGCDTRAFSFVGFPPVRSSERQKWLRALGDQPHTIIMFEAPHRVRQTLTDMRVVFGDREVAVGRELTKTHEELVKRPINDVLLGLGEPKGEFTIVLPAADGGSTVEASLPVDSEVRLAFGQLTADRRLGRRAAIANLAEQYGVSQKQVYAAIERAKKQD